MTVTCCYCNEHDSSFGRNVQREMKKIDVAVDAIRNRISVCVGDYTTNVNVNHGGGDQKQIDDARKKIQTMAMNVITISAQ